MDTGGADDRRGIAYEHVGKDYLEQRSLRRGAAGWILLAGLGVSYVISGDFAGWNFGLAQGGFGGLLVATLLMGAMYLCLVLTLAELSSAIPTAGGGYGFARRAFGPWGGFLTGTAILLEYAIAPAAIAVFIGAYVHSLVGWDGPVVYLAFYTFFIGLHLYGVGEALKLMFGISMVALLALLVFAGGMVTAFDVEHLLDIAPTAAAGASAWLPFGYVGIWAAIPYAIWFFLAVEGVPLAAEETRNPSRDLPRGLIAAMSVLLVVALVVLALGPGGAGSAALQQAGNPLVVALEVVHGPGHLAARVVNFAGLAGLVASFFSILFAYSRQTFALSRAGYLPRFLSLTSHRKAPYFALLVPGALGFALSLTGQGDLLILVAVFGATLSYVFMMAAHIVLRVTDPAMPRPYRTPGGVVTSGLALLLALLALVAGLLVEPEVLLWSAFGYAILIAYFGVYSRHHLVAEAPEEELALLAQAESELERR